MKSIIFLLFALSCFTHQTTAQVQELCQFRFFPGEINNDQYIYYDGDNVAPFTGWAWVDFNQQTERETRTYSGLRAVQAGWCETCILTVYSTTTFGGRIALFNFKDDFEFVFPFCAHSFRIQCEPREEPGPEEEEEEEVQIEFEPVELTADLTYLRDFGYMEALFGLVSTGRIPSGAYQLTETVSVGQSTNVENYYKFVVHISDQEGNQFGVDYIVLDADPSNPSLFSYDVFSIV